MVDSHGNLRRQAGAQEIAATKPDVHAGEVAKIVGSVFKTMLGLQTRLSEHTWTPQGEWLTSGVDIAGGWSGSVLIQCDRSIACEFAGRFLATDPPGVTDSDIRDVLAELAKMIGGNMIRVLAKGIRLATPRVADRGDYRFPAGGAEVRERIPFECDAGTFRVVVVTTD